MGFRKEELWKLTGGQKHLMRFSGGLSRTLSINADPNVKR
jgi:hypothetical protein